MNACLRIAAACAVLALALPSAAEDTPLPKVYQSMGTQKGQWKVDILESGGAKSERERPSMTICSDNLMNQSRQNAQGAAKKAQAERGGRRRSSSTGARARSEENTSELQSHSDLVCRLL